MWCRGRTPALAGTNWDFIDRDPDRFNVWVYDPAKYNAGTATVDVTLSTVNAPFFEQHNDPETTLRLVKHKTFAGWYWSDSQMLVSNEVDDKHSGVPLPPYLGADESAPSTTNVNEKEDHKFPVTDRTHRVALAGTVKAKYEFAPGQVVTDDAPVNVKKNVKLNITILREWAGGPPAVLQDYVFEDIRRMQEIYAQVGIAIPFEFVAIKTVDPPTAPAPGVNLALPEGLHDYTQVINEIIQMTDEEKALLGATNPRLRTTTEESGGKDDIEVYYVNNLSSGAKGRSYWAAGVPKDVNGVPDARYADSLILDGIRLYTTLAHEAGHVLMNDGEHFPHPAAESPLDSVNLMVVLPRARHDETVYDSRRLTLAQQIAMIGDPSTTPPTPAKRPNLLFDP